MKEDAELLRDFATQGDQRAFRELVDRHVALVYSSAVRQLNGDTHLASDVTQLVFTDLARKARSLVAHRVLAGWLFTSTRFAVSKVVRSEQRRRACEQEAQTMHELLNDPDAQLDWSRVRPVLDAALADLSEADREAILLRYFERLDYAAIGARLRMADNTVRMRVDRARDRLRAGLARRGLTSTAAALATVLAAEAVAAPPVGLAASVTGAALAGGGAASFWTLFMSMTKLQVGITGVLAIAGATGFVAQARTNAALQEQVDALKQHTAIVATVRAENEQLARNVNEVSVLQSDTADFTAMSNEAADLKKRLVAVERRQAASKQKTDGVYDVAALDQLPTPKTRKAPAYPAELRKAGVTGEVTVDFIVDKNGAVKNAQAVKSSRPEFEAPAVEAVSNWVFDAGVKGGRPVNTHMQVPIVFALSNEQGKAGDPVPVNNTAPKG